MKTRTNTIIKARLESGLNLDIKYPKGTDIKWVILDLLNWCADDDLNKFQADINKRIEFIKLNN